MSRIDVYNVSILQIVARHGQLTIEELKKEYLPPEQPGVIQGSTVMFDSDLKQLEELGGIEVKDGVIKFLGYPKSRIV